jgi:ABC-type polysaccharide/polyol phosphate export permease
LSVDTSTDTKTAKGAGVSDAVRELLDRRWLVWFFIQRQLAQGYRGSFLGMSWLVLGPLLMVALYTLVFSEIIGLRFAQTDSVSNYGLYLYCGLLPFLAFSQVVTKSTNSIRNNQALVKRVIFPLEVLPIATAATALITQLFGFGALVALVFLFEGSLNWTMLLLPLVVAPQAIFMVGTGFLTTVAGAYLPDLREALTAIVRVMLFATPIIWPPALAYDRGLGFLVDYNPLAVMAGSYRSIALEGIPPDAAWLGGFTLFSIALLAVGMKLFVKAKRNFADFI